MRCGVENRIGWKSVLGVVNFAGIPPYLLWSSNFPTCSCRRLEVYLLVELNCESFQLKDLGHIRKMKMRYRVESRLTKENVL